MARAVTIDEERRGLGREDAGLQVVTRDDSEKRFVGHAAVFDQRTAIGNPLRWGFYEEIAPGAFSKTISEGDQRKLIDHDSYYVVSRVSAGTLLLAQDAIGLAVDSALDTELSYVRDLIANLRNGNITGMSFGFYVIQDEWTTETKSLDDGTEVEVEVRRILETKTIEVSSVTFPAYPQTDAGLRAVRTALRNRGDADAIRRRLGFKPELGMLLDELPTRTVIPVNGRKEEESVSDAADTDEARVEDVDTTEVSSAENEPGETTRSEEEPTGAASEPGETTRNAPSDVDLAKARLSVLRQRLRRPSA